MLDVALFALLQRSASVIFVYQSHPKNIPFLEAFADSLAYQYTIELF